MIQRGYNRREYDKNDGPITMAKAGEPLVLRVEGMDQEEIGQKPKRFACIYDQNWWLAKAIAHHQDVQVGDHSGNTPMAFCFYPWLKWK